MRCYHFHCRLSVFLCVLFVIISSSIHETEAVGAETKSTSTLSENYYAKPRRLLPKNDRSIFMNLSLLGQKLVTNLKTYQNTNRRHASSASSSTTNTDSTASFASVSKDIRKLQTEDDTMNCNAFGDDTITNWETSCANLISPLLRSEVVAASTVTDWCSDNENGANASCYTQLNELIDIALQDGSPGCMSQVETRLRLFQLVCLKHPNTNEYCWIDTPLPLDTMAAMFDHENGLATNEEIETFCTPCALEMYTQYSNAFSGGGTAISSNTEDLYCSQIDGVYCYPIIQQGMFMDQLTDGDIFCHPCMIELLQQYSEEDEEATASGSVQEPHELACNTVDDNGNRCFDVIKQFIFEEENLYDGNSYSCFSEFENGIDICYDNCTEYLNYIESTAGCCTSAFVILMDDEYTNSSFHDFFYGTCTRAVPDSCDYVTPAPIAPNDNNSAANNTENDDQPDPTTVASSASSNTGSFMTVWSLNVIFLCFIILCPTFKM